jgi:hypothetical protein
VALNRLPGTFQTGIGIYPEPSGVGAYQLDRPGTLGRTGIHLIQFETKSEAAIRRSRSLAGVQIRPRSCIGKPKHPVRNTGRQASSAGYPLGESQTISCSHNRVALYWPFVAHGPCQLTGRPRAIVSWGLLTKFTLSVSGLLHLGPERNHYKTHCR